MAPLVAWLGLDAHGVKVVGEIPAKLPSLRAPASTTIDSGALGGALAIAVLGLLEAIAMAKAIAAQTRQKLDMNQQCLSEGRRELYRQLFPVLSGLGVAYPLGDQPASGRGVAVVGRLIRCGGGPDDARVCFVGRIDSPRRAGRDPDRVGGRMVDWNGLSYHLRVTRFDAISWG